MSGRRGRGESEEEKFAPLIPYKSNEGLIDRPGNPFEKGERIENIFPFLDYVHEKISPSHEEELPVVGIPNGR